MPHGMAHGHMMAHATTRSLQRPHRKPKELAKDKSQFEEDFKTIWTPSDGLEELLTHTLEDDHTHREWRNTPRGPLEAQTATMGPTNQTGSPRGGQPAKEQ